MAQGPSLIFDKSSLESLNLDEAVLMDNFYMSTITPLFFVECLADLEKTITSRSTPEQLVGSLADRTPESQSSPNVHHMTILKAELSRQFDLGTVYGRVMPAGGEPVQLGDKKGFVFHKSPEAEALERWTKREFLDVERNIAKQWRRSLTTVDFDAMVEAVMGELGHWRKAKTLADAKQIADTIIDYMVANLRVYRPRLPARQTLRHQSAWTPAPNDEKTGEIHIVKDNHQLSFFPLQNSGDKKVIMRGNARATMDILLVPTEAEVPLTHTRLYAPDELRCVLGNDGQPVKATYVSETPTLRNAPRKPATADPSPYYLVRVYDGRLGLVKSVDYAYDASAKNPKSR
jgi:hypothetical protein